MRTLILLAVAALVAAGPSHAQVRPDLPMAQPPAQSGDIFVFRRGGQAHRGMLQQFMVPGPAGPAGQSIKGDKGDRGDTGQAGASITGPQGPQGAVGAAGPVGAPKRVISVSATSNASSVATVTFSPAFAAPPVILLVDKFVGEQMISGTVTAVTATSATISVRRSRGTLLLTSGPFEPAPSTSVTIIAIGD